MNALSVNESSKPSKSSCCDHFAQQLKNYAVICCYLRSAGENVISTKYIAFATPHALFS